LILALRELVEESAERGNLKAELDIPELDLNISAQLEHGVYRIAQETLENIIRHSRATKIVVNLSFTDQAIQLMISDDGIGFDLEGLSEQPGHFGVRGIRERAEVLGGTVDIQSELDQGTKILLKVGLT